MDNTEDYGDDKLSWSSKEEEYLINLMVFEVRKGSLSSSTFHKRTWTQIDNQMFEKFKRRYTVTKLKQKFNRLRSKWKLFKELIECTGFGWDPERNTIDADEEKWAKKIGENKEYKQFRKRGCDHYDLLGEIFFETVATGKLARSSAQGPLNSNEEQEVEEVFLHGTASSSQFPNDPIDPNGLDDNMSEMESPSSNRKSKKRSKSRANSHAGSHSKSQCVDSSIVDEAWAAFKDAQLSKKKAL